MPTPVDEIGFDGLIIAVGDAADPEVFTARCSMNNSRSFNRSGETKTRVIPDCDSDATPGFVNTYVTSLSAEVSGSGVMERADGAFFSAWWASGESKNIEVIVGDVSNGGEKHSFAARLTSFNISAERNDVINAEITLASHGPVTTAALA
jgi:hypothetical protein